MSRSVCSHSFVLSFPLALLTFISYLVSTQFHSFLCVSFCSIIMTPFGFSLRDKDNEFNSHQSLDLLPQFLLFKFIFKKGSWNFHSLSSHRLKNWN